MGTRLSKSTVHTGSVTMLVLCISHADLTVDFFSSLSIGDPNFPLHPSTKYFTKFRRPSKPHLPCWIINSMFSTMPISTCYSYRFPGVNYSVETSPKLFYRAGGGNQPTRYRSRTLMPMPHWVISTYSIDLPPEGPERGQHRLLQYEPTKIHDKSKKAT